MKSFEFMRQLDSLGDETVLEMNYPKVLQWKKGGDRFVL
jgi:hypothetical protein